MTIKIICDNCKNDLSFSAGSYEHSLILKDRHFGPSTDMVYDFYFYPFLEEDKNFCGFACLKKWLEKKDQEEK